MTIRPHGPYALNLLYIAYIATYPLVIKHGDVSGKPPMNGGSNRKIIDKWSIFHCLVSLLEGISIHPAVHRAIWCLSTSTHVFGVVSKAGLSHESLRVDTRPLRCPMGISQKSDGILMMYTYLKYICVCVYYINIIYILYILYIYISAMFVYVCTDTLNISRYISIL